MLMEVGLLGLRVLLLRKLATPTQILSIFILQQSFMILKDSNTGGDP